MRKTMFSIYKEAQMQSNTQGISNNISSVTNKVYSISHGSGTALLIKDADGQLYEVDVRPAHLGNHKDTFRRLLMQSENEQDKQTFYESERQSAQRSNPIDFPTGENQ